MAKKQNPRHTDHHRAVIKLLESFSPRHRIHRVWEDFIASAACAISSPVEPARRASREAEYAKIQARYTPEEMAIFSQCLAHVVMALEERYQDFLGSLYMGLNLGNAGTGQFFTPYEVSLLMARMLHGQRDLAAWVRERGGFVTLNDPCTGGGAMLIAVAEQFRDQGLSPHRTLHVTGVDIDRTAVQMSYIQLSLLNVPAILLLGNSLSQEPYKGWNTESAWRTPAHCLFGWERRLHERDEQDAAQRIRLRETEPSTEGEQPPPVIAVPSEGAVQLNLLELEGA